MELLPLWLAPNMVTLLGFFFILTNVTCLEIWIPDLVGPVGSILSIGSPEALCVPGSLNKPRVLHGCIIALPLDYGCEQRWEQRS